MCLANQNYMCVRGGEKGASNSYVLASGSPVTDRKSGQVMRCLFQKYIFFPILNIT
jgi:hypothetical protein